MAISVSEGLMQDGDAGTRLHVKETADSGVCEVTPVWNIYPGQTVRSLACMDWTHAPEMARRLGAALNSKETQELLSLRSWASRWMATEISVLAP